MDRCNSIRLRASIPDRGRRRHSLLRRLNVYLNACASHSLRFRSSFRDAPLKNAQAKVTHASAGSILRGNVRLESLTYNNLRFDFVVAIITLFC